jgi:hypothetical protein
MSARRTVRPVSHLSHDFRQCSPRSVSARETYLGQSVVRIRVHGPHRRVLTHRPVAWTRKPRPAVRCAGVQLRVAGGVARTFHGRRTPPRTFRQRGVRGRSPPGAAGRSQAGDGPRPSWPKQTGRPRATTSKALHRAPLPNISRIDAASAANPRARWESLGAPRRSTSQAKPSANVRPRTYFASLRL